MHVGVILRDGFELAHSRPGAIVFDLVWKLIWLATVAAILIGCGLWIYWELGATEVHAPAAVLRSPVVLMFLARQLWSRFAPTILWIFSAFLAAAYLAWILLEAYFRSRVLADLRRPFFENSAGA